MTKAVKITIFIVRVLDLAVVEVYRRCTGACCPIIALIMDVASKT